MTTKTMPDATIGGRRWIHLNAAGSSPSSDASHAATIWHLELEKEMGGYGAASASPVNPQTAIARLLNCSSAEIAIADSAQQAWARAFYSLNFLSGDCILCFEDEYAGNAVAFLQMKKRCPGLQLEVLPMRPDGVVDFTALEAALQQNIRRSAAESSMTSLPRVLIALTHVQTNSLIVQPAVVVGTLVRSTVPSSFSTRASQLARCRWTFERSGVRLLVGRAGNGCEGRVGLASCTYAGTCSDCPVRITFSASHLC